MGFNAAYLFGRSMSGLIFFKAEFTPFSRMIIEKKKHEILARFIKPHGHRGSNVMLWSV